MLTVTLSAVPMQAASVAAPICSRSRSAKPVAPNRLLLLPLTLLIALAAGVVVSFVASQMRPVFMDARSVREVTGLPLLGSVSLVVDEASKRRERKGLYGFLAGLVSLIGVYGVGILLLFLISTRTA